MQSVEIKHSRNGKQKNSLSQESARMVSSRNLNEFAVVFRRRKCAFEGSVLSGMYKFRDFSTSPQMEEPQLDPQTETTCQDLECKQREIQGRCYIRKKLGSK